MRKVRQILALWALLGLVVMFSLSAKLFLSAYVSPPDYRNCIRINDVGEKDVEFWMLMSIILSIPLFLYDFVKWEIKQK